MNDEMHFCGFWLLVCEDGADIGPFVVDVDILDLDAVLCDCCVLHQDDARVQRPLLTSRKQNGGAVEPCHSRYFAVHIASGGEKRHIRDLGPQHDALSLLRSLKPQRKKLLKEHFQMGAF